MALELVCGADFWCNRHCRTTPVVLEGFWGQVWPKISRKPEKSEFRIANEPLRPRLSAFTWAPLGCPNQNAYFQYKIIAALCRGALENREVALELVCGVDFWCNRHCRTTPVVLEGFWGQVWPKIGRTPEKSEFRIANEPRTILHAAAQFSAAWTFRSLLLMQFCPERGARRKPQGGVTPNPINS